MPRSTERPSRGVLSSLSSRQAPLARSQYVADTLGVTLKTVVGGGHLNSEAGFEAFPQLYEETSRTAHGLTAGEMLPDQNMPGYPSLQASQVRPQYPSSTLTRFISGSPASKRLKLSNQSSSTR